MNQLIGQQLGRYHIEEEIGKGGMARVYRALDTSLQRPVAIKVLDEQLVQDEEFSRRFQREAVLAANLSHDNIVKIYDVGEQAGLRYIAMEFIDGRSLYSILLERGGLGLGYAVSILEPLVKALDYAHQQGAVHRDVKPHNILIDSKGRILLTDFGIAQLPDADKERLTQVGVFIGTPEYISPEQAQGLRVDSRSDIYSLAIVAYEIITGNVPFAGNTQQLIIAHARTPPPPLSIVSPDLPSELDSLFLRALAKKPQDRFQTSTALVEELRTVARNNSIPLATQEQIAPLAVLPSSAGHPTAPMSGTTPVGSPSGLAHQPTQRVPTPPRPLQQSAAPPPGIQPPSKPADTAAPPPRPPRRLATDAESEFANEDERPAFLKYWPILAIALIGVLALGVLQLNSAGGSANDEFTATPTTPTFEPPTPITPQAPPPPPPEQPVNPGPPTEPPAELPAEPTSELPTETPTILLPTEGPTFEVPTETPTILLPTVELPTEVPTEVPVVVTATAEPPTATAEPTATETPDVTATSTITATLTSTPSPTP